MDHCQHNVKMIAYICTRPWWSITLQWCWSPMRDRFHIHTLLLSICISVFLLYFLKTISGDGCFWCTNSLWFLRLEPRLRTFRSHLDRTVEKVDPSLFHFLPSSPTYALLGWTSVRSSLLPMYNHGLLRNDHPWHQVFIILRHRHRGFNPAPVFCGEGQVSLAMKVP